MNDNDNTQRHILLIRNKGPQQIKKGFLYRIPKLQKHWIYKWGSAHSIQHNWKCNRIRHRGINMNPFLKWSVIRTYLRHLEKNGTHPTRNINKIWQFHCTWNWKQYSVPKKSKTTDMRFYWIQYRMKQVTFHVSWKLSMTNLGEYFTKHHPPHHHREMRSIYLCKNPTTYKASDRVCSLVIETEHLSNNNTSAIQKYNW